jgi:hypothetical protein
MELAARHRDLRHFTLLLAQQTLTDRARCQDFVVVRILGSWADQFERLVLIDIQISHGNAAAEDHGVLGEAGLIDDERSRQFILGHSDLRLEHALVFAGGMVFGVLTQIAHLAGCRHPLGNLNHFDVFHAIQFGLFLLIAFRRHGDLIESHRLPLLNGQSSETLPTELQPRARSRPMGEA